MGEGEGGGGDDGEGDVETGGSEPGPRVGLKDGASTLIFLKRLVILRPLFAIGKQLQLF